MLNDKKISEDFAERFYNLRRKKKLTQKELGDLVGLHPTHVGKYERGLSTPSANNAKLIADALGTTVDFLMHGDINSMAKSKLHDRELLNLFKEIETFPEEDQLVIKKLINAFVAKKKIEDLAKS